MKRFALILFTLQLSLAGLHAHAGCAHGPTPGEEESAGLSLSIELSPPSIQNLGILTKVARIEPLAKQLVLPAHIEPLPEKNAQITARFEGSLLEALVKLGEHVKKDQPLLKLDPLAIGNPPVIYRSPLDGYVTQLDLQQGQPFTQGQILMQVSDYSQLLVKGTAFDRVELQALKIGQPAKITLDLFPTESLTGTVQRFDRALESQSRTLDVFVLLNNADLRLRPHQQATLSLEIGEKSEVLSVPSRAILGDSGDLFVFVREGNRFERRTVTVGSKFGDEIEILEGILPEEEVVIQGNYQLQYAKSTEKDKAKLEPEPCPDQESTAVENSSWRFWTLITLGISLGAGFLFYFWKRFSDHSNGWR